jgi:predicted DNA binding CopG/RHH family protein
MPQSAESVSSRTSGSFASLLASFTGKLQNDAWDDSVLADDVATITYEQALSAHRRGRTRESATISLLDESAENVAVAPADSADRPSKLPQTADEKKPKAASITIRVTTAEQAQLQERAAAAQLSVSAYLRSCIFEAETLRTQVKDALLQIRSATPPDVPASEELQRKRSGTWRAHLLPPWRGRRASA